VVLEVLTGGGVVLIHREMDFIDRICNMLNKGAFGLLLERRDGDILGCGSRHLLIR